jgi:Hydantoinase/oxoprolinase
VNAAIMPLVSRYLDALESRLQNQGIAAPFYVMQSSGGVMSVQSAKRRPVYKVESGPAAGVIAAGAFALPPWLRQRHLLRHGGNDGEGRAYPQWTAATVDRV